MNAQMKIAKNSLKLENYKILHLVRHGESEYNKWRRESFTKFNLKSLLTYDPEILDPHLSFRGREQCHHLNSIFSKNNLTIYSHKQISLVYAKEIYNIRVNKLVEQLNEQYDQNVNEIELVITSPMTRAIESAELIFKNSNFESKIIAWPEIYEWTLTKSDWGSNINNLKLEFEKCNFSMFDEYSDQPWWYSKELKKSSWFRKIEAEPKERLTRRAKFFLEKISQIKEKHVCVIGHSLFFKELTKEKKMKNCEVRSYLLDCNEKKLIKLQEFWTFI